MALSGEADDIRRGTVVPLSETDFEMVIRTQRLVVQQDNLPAPSSTEVVSKMYAPLTTAGQVIGSLNVGSKQPNSYTARDENLLLQVASLLASTIESRRLIGQIQQRAAELEETTGFLDSIVENIPNMIFVKDAEELRFVRFNRAGEELIGVSREEMIGKNDYDFFPKTEADFFVAKDREVLESGQLVDIQEETIQTALQGTRYLHTTKVPVYGTDGRPKFLLGISEDITERKRAEAERELLLDEVQVAYRQYIRREWDQFLREHAQGSWHVEHQQPGLRLETSDEALAEVQKSVMLEGKTNIDTKDQDNGHGSPGTVVAPISLRGEILGTLSLQDVDPARLWTADEIALIETVSEQLALTLENLRLFEDTQQLATREKIIADVTQQVWASGELEQVMQTAVEQLGAKLDASKVVIRLGTEDQLLADNSSDSEETQ
jgi:PAS domain S-box-containing protein